MPVIPVGDTVDRRPEVLPAGVLELFDDRFVRSWDLYEAYTNRLAVRLAREIELTDDDVRTPAEIADRAGLDPDRARPVLAWLVATLAHGVAGRGEPSTGTPDDILAEQLVHDPSAAPSYDLAERAATACTAVMRGETTGEEVLLAPDRMAAWGAYFSNDNPLYAINNRVGALGCVEWAPAGRLRVLELGGGLGSGAEALLEALAGAGRLDDLEVYRFTDLSVPLVRRGMRSLQAAWGDRVPLQAGRLDMDRSFVDQGIEPRSVELMWAVNTLHVAHDLAATLRQVHDALVPGGVVVLGECVRPFDGQPVPPELIFNLLDSFRAPDLSPGWRPNGGFLTADQWAAGFRSAGLEPVGTLPDIVRVREHYPSFVVAAVGARRPA
jgi:SAM-dependent methyltransferase